MYNETQEGILSLYKEQVIDGRDALMELVFKAIELKYNVTLSREPNSNIYIFISNAIDGIMDGKNQFNTFISNLESFFDSNKFDGYNSGTYSGLVQALKGLSAVEDIKLSLLSAGTLAIILKLQQGSQLTDVKKAIATMIHKYISVGIVTSVPATEPQIPIISVIVNASNGQAITYNFCECLERKFNFKVTYFVDYEQEVADFDIQQEILSAIDEVYASKYYSIGKNFNVQDFYGITGKVSGVKRLLFTLEEVDNLGTVINTFEDIDIEMADWEILIKNKVNLLQAN